MIRTRSARAFVALVTALLVLVCQTAFAAEACAHNTLRADTDVATMPCHEADGGSPADTEPASACQISKALPDASKVPVFALADLPVVLVAYAQLAMPQASARTIQAVQAVCFSPPLSILHCRFLN